MKDLNEMGLQELTQQELLEIGGGNIFRKAWNWLCSSVMNTISAGRSDY